MELLTGLLTYIRDGGWVAVATLFAFIIFYGGWKKWWVFGWYAKMLEDRATEWEGRYFKQAEQTAVSVRLAEDLQKAQSALQASVIARGSLQ